MKKNSEFHKQDIKDYIDKVSQNEWESFSDLFEKINEIREILFDDTNWKLSKCSCCYWLKNYMCSHIIILAVTLKLVEFPQASMQIPIGQNRKRGRPNKTKKALVRQNENNSLSPRSSQTDSSTSESDNSSLLVDRILNANKRFRDQDIDDTANDADINLSCEVNIISNAYDINAQTTTIEESSNSQAAVESNESDDIIIESYIGPSSKGPGKGVKMSAEFYKYATDKIKKEKQENQVAKENMKAKTKQTQDPPALRRSHRTKKN